MRASTRVAARIAARRVPMARAAARALFYAGALSLVGACNAYVKYDDGPEPDNGGGSGATNVSVQGVEEGRFDHSLLDGILREHVKVAGEQTLVDYDAIAESPLASAALNAYRLSIASTDPSSLTGLPERLTFYINAYNASVIAGVLGEYGGSDTYSVMDSGAFFNTRFLVVAGVEMSLDELEHGIIRGDYDAAKISGERRAYFQAQHEALWTVDGKLLGTDPRIHMALNCAALSCPNLQPRAWSSETIAADLQVALEAFLANAEKGAGPSGISELFTWFAGDFLAVADSIAAYIEANRPGGLDGVSTSGTISYDWTLNRVKP